MKYSKGYKYQLKGNVVIQTRLRPEKPAIIQGFIFLGTDGKLFIYNSYAWNGATCAPDLKSNMLAVLVHDALFQLIQEGLLPDYHFKECNEELHDIMISEGAQKLIAEVFYLGVSKFGKKFYKKKTTVFEV
jgi:hypothetical protein